jgi:serine/threonine-protein kinase
MSEIASRLSAALADRYAIQGELGAGGMATVYLAHDLKHDRSVAIKVFSPELAAIVGGARFLNEIKVTANLNHPYILPLHDSGEADGLLYYVMPHIKGESLRDRLHREGHLPVDVALGIARKVALALDAAHQEGIVHRDIKPENILLNGDEPIVADFGVARALSVSGGTQVTKPGMAVGTPAYMSPEQAAAEDIDARADIYALATVLYEMLAGDIPYPGESVQAIMSKRMFDPIPSVRNARPGVPTEVDRAITRALAKEPADRFATAAEFADALDAVSGARAVASRAHSPWSSLRVPVGAVVAIAVAVFAWNVFGGNGAAPTAGPTRVAVLPFTVRGSDGVAYLGEGMVSLLSTKLDGAGTWRTVDPRAVASAVESAGHDVARPESARELARTLQAGLYVLGDIVGAGARVRLDAALYDTDSGLTPVANASAEGTAEEVLTLVDQVAAQLLVGRPGSTGERLTQIAALTTSSLPALKAYLRGTRLMWNAQFAEAGDELRTAVREDSTFALAWYQLSVAADWMLRPDIGLEAAEQAVRFGDRLSERDRRLLEALWTVRSGRALEAERLYRAIINTYPRDAEAWYQLSEVLFHFVPREGRPLAESRAALERLVELEPSQLPARVHLARLAAAEGSVEELDALVEQLAGLSEDSRVPLETRMLQVLARNDDLALQALLEQLRGHSEADLPELAWATGTFSGNWEGVRRILVTFAEPDRSPEMRAHARRLLGYLTLAEGRWSDAAAEFDVASQWAPVETTLDRALVTATPFVTVPADTIEAVRQRVAALPPPPASASPLVWSTVHDGIHDALRAYLLGLLDARLGDLPSARSSLEQLESAEFPRGSGSLGPDLALGLRATIALAAGDTTEAASILDALQLDTWQHYNVASAFFSAQYERFVYARALQHVGRFDDALRWYRSSRETSLRDLVFFVPGHFHSGEILEARGDSAAAVAHYRVVLDRWADADTGLQGYVTASRAGIARLTGE